MHKEEIILIQWECYDELDTFILCFYNVRFYEDFGVFQADELYSDLIVDYIIGKMYTTDVDGNELKYQYFKCTITNG